MYGKDIERLVRSFVAQKLDVAYIRHYLEDAYQLDAKSIDDIFRRLNLLPPPGVKPGPGKGDAPAKLKKQGFW